MNKETIIDILKFFDYLGIFLLGVWLQALIIPDMVSQHIANNLGYLALGLMVGCIGFLWILDRLDKEETKELLIKKEVEKRYAEKLDSELTRLKRS